MARLTGRSAIVTGAAQGLGFAIARQFVDEGAEVLLADVQSDKVALAASNLAAGGARTLAQAVDVRRADQVAAMAETAVGAFGKIDILVNCAGGSGNTDAAGIEEVTEETWDEVVGSNLKGTFLCSRAVVPHLKRNGYGRIVNFASGAVHGMSGPVHTTAARLPYAAAKAGILGLTNQMAKDLAAFNVTVNVLFPGFVLTEKGARVRERFDRMSEADRQAMLERLPRTPTRPEDVAWAVLFLASAEGGNLNGMALSLSGQVNGRPILVQGSGSTLLAGGAAIPTD